MKQTPSNLLIIGYVWPEPNSSAAGTRMMQLINVFKSQGWSITFASPAKLGEHKQALESLGVNEVNIELNNSSFDEFISQLKPQIVIFDRFMMEEQFGWRVEEFAPNALRILNTEDLHSLRACRHKIVKHAIKECSANNLSLNLATLNLNDANSLFNHMAVEDMAKREIASILRSDLTLMISQFEIALLKSKFGVPATQLFYLPFQYPQGLNTELPSFEARNHFVTIGNFRHEPNWDAVLWLKEAIWPLIKKQLPQAQMHIYGAYPPPKATALHNEKQGFLIKGWADDAFEVIKSAKVLLAPLRFGAGIKGKLAEAMIMGTPNVTTLIGCEAMYQPDTQNWPGAIANSADEFAKQAVEIYQNPNLWQQHQTSGFEIFTKEFEQELEQLGCEADSANKNYSKNFISSVEQTLDTLKQHRAQHFMGAMLNHHHHKSTKFMAQWIEVKNSK